MPWSSMHYAGWDYWELGHNVTFDPVRKFAIINPSATEFNIKEELYSAYKQWFKLRANSGRGDEAIRTIGGDPTVGSEFAGDIYFMQNGWRIVMDPRSTAVTGAIFSDDFDSAWVVPVTYEKFYPVKVASIVTQIQADLGDLAIPSATETAAAVRTELTAELAVILNDLLRTKTYIGLQE